MIPPSRNSALIHLFYFKLISLYIYKKKRSSYTRPPPSHFHGDKLEPCVMVTPSTTSPPIGFLSSVDAPFKRLEELPFIMQDSFFCWAVNVKCEKRRFMV